MKKLLFVILTLFIFGSVAAQAPEKDFIIRAMKDELARNSAELKLPGHDKPFFIMYGITNLKSYSVTATLGALLQSIETPTREKTTVRILVGDYEFNDESLDDDLTSPPSLRELPLPIDNDYEGIRRSLWSTTDNVYRNAARHFKRHQETLAEMKKTIDEVPHRRFGRVPPVQLISDSVTFQFDTQQWEQKAKDLSALFLGNPAITHSGIVIQCVQGYRYLANTEGTLARVPQEYIVFMALARTKNDAGEFQTSQVFHVARNQNELPSGKQLEEEVKTLIAGMEEKEQGEAFTEEYSGPVLLLNESVSDFLLNAMFSEESIVASDNIQRLKGYQYTDPESGLDQKIGKLVTSKEMTVKARPKLKSFQGIPLVGSYEIDSEGVVPPDELTLIDNGVLKDLLNNRTLTHPTHAPNGFSGRPGVLEITFTYADSEQTLKEKLIRKAKEEGLAYALIVRESGSLYGTQSVYKISVADGSETRLRNARVGFSNLRGLKKVMSASGTYWVDNRSGDQQLSLIVPRGLLVEEVDVTSFRIPSLKQDEYVSHPLLKK